MDPPPTAQKRKNPEADEDSQQQVAIERSSKLSAWGKRWLLQQSTV
jgi:hypothetical protein